ncbi:MAG: hypothetical protein DMG58_23615 [Acidobacteria bacterium]|nr:MAG: hypothetical protein DMG58_23615 [Acidobacteriota bacterium]
MISRRSFLQTAAAATVGFALPLSAHVITSEPEVGMEGWKFGVWGILHQYSENCDCICCCESRYQGRQRLFWVQCTECHEEKAMCLERLLEEDSQTCQRLGIRRWR